MGAKRHASLKVFHSILGDLFDELMTVLIYNELIAGSGRAGARPAVRRVSRNRLEKMKQSYRFDHGQPFRPDLGVNFLSSWTRDPNALGLGLS